MSKIFTLMIIVLISVQININSVYSNWMPIEKNNNTFIETDKSQFQNTSSNITEEQDRGYLDENGVPLLSQNDMAKNTDDSLQSDAISERILNGLTAGDYLGSSVSGAGDVNGDGYEDVIVGAPLSDYTGANSGRAYIYFGGPVFNSVPDKILSGIAGELLGTSVSSAGDVNGDGYDDVIVSLPGYLSNTGRAYIYYGGADMNTTRDITLTGEATGDYFGNSVAGAGDVNGDGFADVIIGAPYKATNTGKAYIYFGGSAMNNVVDVTLIQNIASEFFGFSVSSAGDFNGDGFSDVIVGAYGYSNSAGRTYMYLGGNTVNNVADMTLLGFLIFESFGYSVSSAGDFNGDGYSDIVVGGYGYSNSLGRVYLYFGGTVLNSNPGVIITGQNTSDQFGKSVSGGGDVNGDGFDDIIIGAENFSSGTGKAYLFNGGTSSDNNADKILSAENTGDRFGLFVSGIGDVNGDGNSDFIIGAPNNDQNGTSSGRAYVYFNSMSGTDIEDLTFIGTADFDDFGMSVSNAGDVNADGFDDIIIGQGKYNSQQGRAYIYFGGSIMDNVADVTLTGVSAGSLFGHSVSAAGDVNGDGFSDVIIGADRYNSNQGRAYIYYGGSSMNNVADVIFTGAASSEFFGASVSSAGDVNSDGFSDVIIGAYGYNAGTNSGRAYIYFGGSVMNNVADVTLTGVTNEDFFGYAVSGAEDVNGDGYSDVIVGAFGYNAGTDQGRAYIYFGGGSMDNNKDITMTGVSASDYFGISVSKAGDVNGDGYSDVIVGASGYNSNQGRSYIYFGGNSMNSTADVIFTGLEQGDEFGCSVSEAGDVNGDGYHDVIIGASAINGSGEGNTYIFWGGSNMNNVADITMAGENNGDQFGKVVSSAGDVNNDGLSDVITNADGNDEGGYFAGKVYLIFSTAPVVNPRLVYVKDVPNDQGGKVNLNWVRSGYDVQNISTITDYVVQKSMPPANGNFAWENTAYIPATNEPFYSYTADTPFDSASNNSGVFYFRITARTSITNQYWRSGILYGSSIDNIAPLMVSPFTASQIISNVSLNWNRSTATDLLNYIIYRSTSPTIDPETEPVFASTIDSTYIDTSPLSGNYYYFIVAQDIHNNKSPVAVVESPNMTLNLTMFIEGFYNTGSNSQVSDSLTVELRNAASPFAVADISKVVVSSDGTATLKFSAAANGNYYTVIKHRNSIETWSNTAIALSRIIASNYNFTTSSSQAYGNNMIQIDATPVRFGIYSGDVNQDGTIDLSDGSLIDNDAFNFANGYLPTDVNGDEITDVADAVFADNNGFNFVGKITP